MPYISAETTKQVKQALKKEFPNVKFSVTTRHSNELKVAVMQSNIDFGTTYEQLNHFYIERNWEHNERAKSFLLKIMEVVDSVKMQVTVSEDSDYGSIPNYYFNLHIGKWDKDYQLLSA